ncbi:eRF1 domain 1-domain-containing protein [Delphinella strobiligena]|nr:eRF1 domain 1-domain-containing protein [Delphinella strobiligena]
MRLIKQNIEIKDGSGTATLLPEEPEDMWHAYNLIRPGDLLRASAIRRVTTESATGSSTSQRVHLTLTLRVTSLDFDTQAAQLHVSGRVAEENKHVKLGAHHTLDLELQRNFTLEKNNGWDSIALETLKESIDQTAKAELWAVVMQEGLANICLITTHQTIHKQTITTTLPKKRPGIPASAHTTALRKFYTHILDALLRLIDLSNLKPLLLASPGFTAQGFQSFIKSTATQKSDKSLQALGDKTIVAHAASGHLHSLAEVLASPAITAKLSDTRFARETALIDSFYTLLRRDDNRAWYGPKEVETAVEKGAVGRGGGVLLISNSLFRAQDVEVRRRWVALVDRVAKEEGGEVRVLSDGHESGRRLEGLGGIAAILTFPLDIDVEDDGVDEEVNGSAGLRERGAGVEGREAIHEDIEI